MTELEQMLTRLGSELDWPQTPELAARVTRRLSEPERTRRRAPVLSGFRRSLAIALVLLVVVAAAAVAAVPSVRDAVLEFFGLQGATVERTTTLPTPPPDRPLDLGSRMSLGDAGAQLAFEPLCRPSSASPTRSTCAAACPAASSRSPIGRVPGCHARAARGWACC